MFQKFNFHKLLVSKIIIVDILSSILYCWVVLCYKDFFGGVAFVYKYHFISNKLFIVYFCGKVLPSPFCYPYISIILGSNFIFALGLGFGRGGGGFGFVLTVIVLDVDGPGNGLVVFLLFEGASSWLLLQLSLELSLVEGRWLSATAALSGGHQSPVSNISSDLTTTSSFKQASKNSSIVTIPSLLISNLRNTLSTC